MESEKIAVIIADTQFLIVESLKQVINSLPNFYCAGTAETLVSLHRVTQTIQKGIIVTDHDLMDFNSPQSLKIVTNQFPDFQFLLLTNSLNTQDLLELNRLGFKNILYKTADRDEITEAFEAIRKGKKYYSEAILDTLLDQQSGNTFPDENRTLTNSEKEIVKLIAEGLTTKEIANRKHLSFHTVNTHRKNIFRKLNVSNASELIMLAIKSGWIDNIEYYI